MIELRPPVVETEADKLEREQKNDEDGDTSDDTDEEKSPAAAPAVPPVNPIDLIRLDTMGLPIDPLPDINPAPKPAQAEELVHPPICSGYREVSCANNMPRVQDMVPVAGESNSFWVKTSQCLR